MQKEIGSNFWLNPHKVYNEIPLGDPTQFNCAGEDFVWLSTGRSAIKFVIETIENNGIPSQNKVAVLPSFTCNTVFEPFIEKGYEVYYYPIGRDLRTTSDSIFQAVLEHNATIVLFHRYFGFDTLDNQIDKLCEVLHGLGKFTIEDCTQCLYSNIRRAKSDYFVGSIRKWTGTPDGGFAVCREGVFETKPEVADKQLEAAKVKASYAKYQYLNDNYGKKSEMLAMYRYAEDILDHQNEIYSISETSAKVQSNLNVLELKQKRRNNYSVLYNSIDTHVFPAFLLDKLEVPLYFPIIVEDRPALQKYLIENDIYAPVIWPKSEMLPIVCDGAENAYKHLLCIPIDQRYDEEDMNRIVKVINNFYR